MALNYNYKVNSPDTSWSNTNAFYSFLTNGYANVHVARVLDVAFQIPQYYGSNLNSGSNLGAWNSLITLARNSSKIMTGDIVFYDFENNGEWDHAAFVDGWANQTFHTTNELIYCNTFSQCGECVPKPRVIEKSGAILYGAGGRSIDNTFSPVNRISVLHLE